MLALVYGETIVSVRPATRDEWQRPTRGWWDQTLRSKVRVNDRPDIDPALLPAPPPAVGTLAGPYGLIIDRSPHGTRIAAATRDEWVRKRGDTSGWTTLIGAPTEDPDPAEGERLAEIAHRRHLLDQDRQNQR